MKKIIIAISIAFIFLSTSTVLAQGVKDSSALKDIAKKAGVVNNDSVGTVVGSFINAALTLVGIIFLALMVYAGVLWMTARGKDEQIEKAKSVIMAAIIGIVITLGAYSISAFVVPRILATSTV